jgi:hypothetical protein
MLLVRQDEGLPEQKNSGKERGFLAVKGREEGSGFAYAYKVKKLGISWFKVKAQ